MNKTIEFLPVIEKIAGGWQAYAHMYEDKSIYTAVEIFNAYDDRQEAWDNAVAGAKQVVKRHNNNCKCGKIAKVGTF